MEKVKLFLYSGTDESELTENRDEYSRWDRGSIMDIVVIVV